MATPHTSEPPRGPRPMVPQPHRVTRVRRETRDTVTLELTPLAGPALRFAPGQFNMLYAFGKGEVAISISGDPRSDAPLLHTVRAVGATTRAICSTKRGGLLGVRGPFGSHWPVRESHGSDVVLVAGGIGLAPLRPAVYQILAERRHFGSVSVLYGTRTPHDLLYRRELQTWRGRFDLDVEVSVDHAAGEPFENVGVVTTLIGGIKFVPSDTVAFVCGPEIMMRYTVMDLLGRGMAPENVWVSLERNMQCALGLCGHCQFGPAFVCKDGPVFRYADVERLFRIREV